MLLAEQLEFDFFAPPEHEKPKTDKTATVSTAIKDEDILNYQLNRDGSRKLQDFGENLNNTRKGRSVNRSTELYKFIQGSPEELEKRLSSEPLDKIWPKSSILELHKDNPEAAACLWLVRSTLSGRRPAKGTYKFRRYLHTASAAIALHRQIINGELAPEAPTDAFDHFYEVGDKYKVLSHISTKYWPFIGAYSIGDAQDICRWNALRLSDDTDIRSYQYQCILPGCRDNKQLCLKNSEGKLFPYYAVAVGNSEKEFEANIEKQLKTTFGKLLEDANQPGKEQESKPEPPIKLYGRGVRNSHAYEVYGKSGTIEFQLTDKIAFESDEAFWNYVNTHRTDLENKYREFRAEFSKTEKDWRSGSPIRDRVGPDYREGKDATPEMFMNTFGFRGVEFGNWVKQGKNGRERQWMLNNAYDSLLDLSKILGIPPRAVALDGELGLCFGSRGHGSASAHYEPTNRLINLTKTKGYSCLAHEWFHALDHYLMRTNYREKLDVRMLSEQVDSEVIFKLTPQAQERINEAAKKIYSLWMGSASRVEYELKTNPKAAELARRVVAGDLDQADVDINIPDRGRELVYKVTLSKEDLLQAERGAADQIRPELHHAWAQTIDTIRSTAMHRRMLKKKAYWHSKTEEAARSFEAYVEVRSQELGITNDFLTNGAFAKKTLDKESYYPYLDGVDVQRVSEKFKSLFEEIKSRETEKGVALFSKTREGKSGAKISEIRAALDKKFGKTTIDTLIDNGRLKIVSGINDVPPHLSPLPEELKNSQKNTKTGFIVPDQLAHEGNTTGCIAVFHPAVPGEIPSGEIVIPSGNHRPFHHSGKGARHLTGTVIEDPKRNLFPQEENKTEASLKTVLQVLASASEIYKEDLGKNGSYHFYSRKLGLAVCTYFDGNKFVVLTQKPVKNPENIWGKKIGGLKGALEFPFNRGSVHLPSSIQDTGGNQTEHQPATAQEATYTSIDYTAKIFSDIQRAKNRYKSEDIEGVQGFYSSELKTSFLIADNLSPESASSVLLHEVGIHMAYDSELKEKVIPLVKEAPRLLEEGFRQRDPVCMAAEIRLKDSGITKDHPNYAEETAAYLVEECSKQRNALPKLQRWYKQMRSAVSVWLFNHGFKDCKTLTTDDFVTIAKSNLHRIALHPELIKSQSIQQSPPAFSRISLKKQRKTNPTLER